MINSQNQIVIAIFAIIFLTTIYLLGHIKRQQGSIDQRILGIGNRNPGKLPSNIEKIKNNDSIKKKSISNNLFSGILQNIDVAIYKSNLNISPLQFIAASFILWIAVLIVSMISGFSFLTSIIFSTIGSLFPFIYIKMKSAKSERAMLKQLPDGLDTIVRSIKTGLPVGEAIRSLAGSKDFPIAKVFSEVNDNLRIGRNIDESFEAATRKFPMPELNFLAISINIQKDTGGNMSEIITNLSDIMRKREKLKSKIRAMSSEARASAMIIGSLPFIMSIVIWFVNPDYISKLWTDSRGHMLTAIGLTSMSIGSFVIWKMIRFRI